jgi:hypothetical protein
MGLVGLDQRKGAAMQATFEDIKRKLVTMKVEVDHLGMGHESLDSAVSKFDELTFQAIGSPVACEVRPNTDRESSALMTEVRALYHEVTFELEDISSAGYRGLIRQIRKDLRVWQHDFVSELISRRKR